MSFRNACGALGLVAGLANALPYGASSLQCQNDGPVQALHANLDASETFCGEYAGYVKPPAAAQITHVTTATNEAGEVTVTVTATSTPTIFMTVMDDHAVASTTTVTRATCTGGPTLAKVVSPTPAPSSKGPSGVTHGGRDAQLPAYLSSYQPAQVSSACSCLASSQALETGTITQTVTATAHAQTVTKTYTTVNSAIVQYVHVGQAHTITATACLTTVTP